MLYNINSEFQVTLGIIKWTIRIFPANEFDVFYIMLYLTKV